MVAAGFLHDFKEDTTVPFETIQQLISPEVSFIVSWLTNSSKGSSAPRAERKAADRRKLSDAPWEAKLIKLLDRIDNLRDMEGAPPSFKTMYADESFLLVDVIGDADADLRKELLAAANALIPKMD
jgi:(p)ppGpp synthase/HD superfamily hydrolase